jgi:prophage antirepressor-like protein
LIVLASPVIGVAFARPLVEFWESYVRRTRKHAYEGDDRVFRFGYNEVRMVMWHGGPWFVASEVCSALGYDDVKEATRHFAAAERATVEGRNGLWLSEAGVEKLAQRSRHPRAREFRLWFEREVMHPFRLARAKEKADHEAMGQSP